MANQGGRTFTVVSAPLRSFGSSKSTKFTSLLSPKSVKQKTLPRFLRETLVLPHALNSVLKSSISTASEARIHSSEELAVISSSLGAFQAKSLLGSVPIESSQADTTKRQHRDLAQRRLIESIISFRHSDSDPLLTIGSDSFTYGELQRLILGQDPPRKVMQAFFTYLNHGNKTLKGVDRVKIVKISLVAEIFSQRKGETPHMRKSPAKYDMVLFPLFVGHWVIVAVRNRDQSILLLDPLRRGGLFEQLAEVLMTYLRTECQHHLLKPSSSPLWSDVYQLSNPETSRFHHSETALYILKHAECYARYCAVALTQDQLRGYGRYVLERLVRCSLREQHTPN